MSLYHDRGMKRYILTRAAVAGVAYFVIVFAVAFALGTLRVVVLIPSIGETTAVLLELSILLALSWKVSRWLIRRFEIVPIAGARLVMSGLAFAILMLAEFAGSIMVIGRTLAEHLEQYGQIPGLLGLLGQILFAAFPIIQGMIGNRRRL